MHILARDSGMEADMLLTPSLRPEPLSDKCILRPACHATRHKNARDKGSHE